jgi:methionine-rich copper-binding protein CopC
MRRLFSAVLLCGCVSTVFAHAVLVETVPPIRGSVAGPDVVFRLRFNSRVDASRSRLELVSPDGKVLPLSMGQQLSPDRLSAKSVHMSRGRYTLKWQVLSADGHITRGQVPFDVR